MSILNSAFTDGHYCKGCGEFFFSKSSMVTLSGYEGSGTYCVCCAKEIIEEELED